MKAKEKKEKQAEKTVYQVDNEVKKQISAKHIEYTKADINEFMEFEDIIDNMIVQKNGNRFLMVVECQGVNYDLMSSMEKVAVEEGFQQFLNTLRQPIQIFIQTRTVNLEASINTYKQKVREIENEYQRKTLKYQDMKRAGTYSSDEMDKFKFELTKQRNLYEYAKDLLADTERISLSKNVLNKKYYIILSHYAENDSEHKYDKEEKRNNAFSELYTNAQSLIRALSACSVSGKILTSYELVDLLYMTYNRDDAELLGVDKAIRSGYDELYTTSTDIFEKKMRALDKKVEEEAIEYANKKILKARTELEQRIAEKEENFDDLIKQMAEAILSDNKEYVGEDVAEIAIKEIQKERKTKKGDTKKDEEAKSKSGN
jgi:hypothetical protein